MKLGSPEAMNAQPPLNPPDDSREVERGEELEATADRLTKEYLALLEAKHLLDQQIEEACDASIEADAAYREWKSNRLYL